MSRWFRFYAEALDDPKVQKLDGDTFKAWINLLCLTAKNGGVLPPFDDIAFSLRIDANAATTLVERLLNATLIDRLNGGVNGVRYAPHGWHERQYKSDTSTERVKRFRQRSKPVDETPPDTETESETEKTPKAPRKRGEGKHLLPENWVLPTIDELPPKARECAEQWTQDSYETHGEAFIGYWRSCRRMMSDWTLTWGNRIVALHSQVMRDQKFGNAPASKQYVSESGYVYRGDLDAVAREAKRRHDTSTLWQVEVDRQRMAAHA